MSQPTGKTNGELARRYVDAVMCDDPHGLVHRHGADRVLRAAGVLSALAVADAVHAGPTSLRDCIAALAPTLRTTEFKVGDPDPTGTPPFCGAEGPSRDNDCTWHPGHEGRPHVAGDDETILEVWW